MSRAAPPNSIATETALPGCVNAAIRPVPNVATFGEYATGASITLGHARFVR